MPKKLWILLALISRVIPANAAGTTEPNTVWKIHKLKEFPKTDRAPVPATAIAGTVADLDPETNDEAQTA